jgi:hypothetical protein
MKKKYSTLLNFALGACVATTLVACSDGDYTGPQIGRDSNPTVNIGGSVLDTNGNPLADVTVSCEGIQGKTNSSGQYVINNLRVHNVIGGRAQTTNSYDEQEMAVTCVVEAPSGYLGSRVFVWPEAQVLNNLYDNTSEGLENTNQPLMWVEGMYAEAATAWLPKLDSEVCGVLRMCSTGQPVQDAQLRLDMWAVDNNNVVEQADDGSSTETVTYSTGMYSTVTDADDGTFCISNVPDDSILRLYAPEYQDLEVSGNGYADVSSSCSGTKPCNNEGAYITTTNEGLVTLGNVCVDAIPAGDTIRPCVANLEGWIYPLGAWPEGSTSIDSPWFDDTLEFALLQDDIDGTDGIDIIFNELLQEGEVDENSVVIFDTDDGSNGDYITDFTAELSGKNLTITTTDPIPADHHILVYLLRDDFRDLSGNFLHAQDIFAGSTPPQTSTNACSDVFFAEEYYSTNRTAYIVVGFKIHSPDSTNVPEVTELAQVCTETTGDADLPELHAAYPRTMRTSYDNEDQELFNLNADSDYEARLEALADVVGGDQATNLMADVRPNYAAITFMPPASGGWQIGSDSDAACETNCSGGGEGELQKVILGSDDGTSDDEANVGDVIYVESIDDFDNISAVAEITLGDCVAPTTTLNYAYNTCGHLGYDNGSWDINPHGGGGEEGYDTDEAEHICALNENLAVPEYGDGGENTDEGVAGNLGIPTLNITCRLLKDRGDAPNVCAPINFAGLYDGTDIDQSLYYSTAQSCNLDDSSATQQQEKLYDATQWAAWGAFPDTIGVAFSEDIALSAAGAAGIVTSGTFDTSITSIGIGNDIGLTDDGDPPDGGQDDGSPLMSADLVQMSIDDVFTLANDDHLEIIDFSGAIVDASAAAHPADNARVIVNDLLPPFVEWAYWDGGLVIQFNEAVNPVLTSDKVYVVNPVTGAPSAPVDLDNATLSMSNTRLSIPIADRTV